MALDTSEGIQAAFAGLGIGQTILAAVRNLPPKETRKAVDYGPILGLEANGTGMKILALIDSVEEDVAD